MTRRGHIRHLPGGPALPAGLLALLGVGVIASCRPAHRPSPIAHVSIQLDTVERRLTGPVRLTALVTGQGDFNPAVTWSVERGKGRLEPTGRASAVYDGPDDGSVVIRATAVDAPWVHSTITFHLSPGTPYRFVPSGVGVDDAAAFQQAVLQHRWIQIAGPDIQIDTPVLLRDETGTPLHRTVIEPAPGYNRVTVHTKIERVPTNPTDPSRSVFDYDGVMVHGSYLTKATAVGDAAIEVEDPRRIVMSDPPRPFAVGQFVYINDTTLYPNDLPHPLLPHDGSVEVRQVIGMRQQGGTITLTLDQPLLRPHQERVVVAHCRPLNFLRIRGLEFTTDYDPAAIHNPEPRAAIHSHLAYRATISDITSTRWAGFSVVLLDTAGVENTVTGVHARALGLNRDGINGWGISLEGQERSLVVDSTAEGFSQGFVVNYSYETIVRNSRAIDNKYVGFAINSDGGAYDGTVYDFGNNPTKRVNGSIRSGVVAGRSTGPSGVAVSIGPYCQECVVDVEATGHQGGVSIGAHATSTTVSGTLSGLSVFGIVLQVSTTGGETRVLPAGTHLDVTVPCEQPWRVVGVNERGNIVPLPRGSGQPPFTSGPNYSACIDEQGASNARASLEAARTSAQAAGGLRAREPRNTRIASARVNRP